jgi:hypothetical protein
MKKFTELSSDIEGSDLQAESGKVQGSVEIESVIDIFASPDQSTTDDLTSENLIALNTDLSNKEIKRGDEVYITARRPAGIRPGMPRSLMAGIKADL